MNRYMSDVDNIDWVKRMIRECRMNGCWIEAEGKMFSPDEAEDQIDAIRYLGEDELKMKDPLKMLYRGDQMIVGIMKRIMEKRENYVKRLIKFGVIKKL